MAHPALTSNHERNTSNTMSEMPSTYIHRHDRTRLLSSMKRLCTHIHQHGRTHLLPSVERLCTYIWSCGNQSLNHIRMALSPKLRILGNWPGASIQRMETTLISDQVGTHPLITLEWPCTYIWSCENKSHSHIRMALSPRLSIPSNWPGTSI